MHMLIVEPQIFSVDGERGVVLIIITYHITKIIDWSHMYIHPDVTCYLVHIYLQVNYVGQK